MFSSQAPTGLQLPTDLSTARACYELHFLGIFLLWDKFYGLGALNLLRNDSCEAYTSALGLAGMCPLATAMFARRCHVYYSRKTARLFPFYALCLCEANMLELMPA